MPDQIGIAYFRRWNIAKESAGGLNRGEPSRAVVQSPMDQTQRLEASRKFAIAAAKLAEATRCHNVVVMDMSGISPITDFYVIATGTSTRQMRTVCDQIDELAEKTGMKSFHRSGYEGETWIAVDYIDVVVHLFSQDARLYYDLENLWGDAKRVKLE